MDAVTFDRAVASIDLHLAEMAQGGPVDGLKVLDIGCGSGAFVRRLSLAGADAWGLDVDRETVSAAKDIAADPERIVLGDGHTLPFEDAAFDCVSFVFSFHHVPAAEQSKSLSEVVRVLVSGGRLFVVEPEPFGAMTEVIKPIDDETDVRTRSQALLRSPPKPLHVEREATYTIARSFASISSLVETVTQADRQRALRAGNPEIMREVERRFDALAVAAEDGACVLEQPCRAFHYVRG